MITELIDRIIDSGQSLGDHIAISEASGATISYRSLADLIRSTTCGLVDAGMSVGDPVLLASRPGIDTFVLAISIVRAGGHLTPFSPYGGESLMRARLTTLKPRWVVSSSSIIFASRCGLIRKIFARRGLSLPRLSDAPGCTLIRIGRRWPSVPNSISYSELSAHASAGTFPDVPPNAQSLSVFTSGTTSDPKAVTHTNRSSGESVRISAGLLELESSETIFTNALHSLLPALISGATTFIDSGSRSEAGKWVASVRRSGASVVFTTPTQIQDAIDHLNRSGSRFPASVGRVILGSAPAHPALLRELRIVAGESVAVSSVYAMTEILPVAIVSADRKLEFTDEGDLIGTPVPEVSVSLASDGELIVSGPHLFDGYMGGERVSEHPTGDLARILASGEIVLTGRKKDMIVRRGENIYPSLYEPTINGIAGVRRCVLVGLPDSVKHDEIVILVIEPSLDVNAEQLRKKVARAIISGSHSIDRLAHPDEIVSMPVPVIGRSGKIDRERLKSQLEVKLQCGLQ